MFLRTGLSTSAVALICALAASPAAAANAQNLHKLDLALRQELAKGTPSQTRVIITVKPGMRPLLRDALRKHGDEVVAEHPSIDALTATVHGIDLEALANDPAIASVAVDAEVTASAAPERVKAPRVDTVSAVNERALRYYSGLRAQLGLTGSELAGRGVVVAVIDSGIAPVADFGLRFKAFVDFTRFNAPIPSLPYDDYGHGTHIAGLIGGSGAQSTNSAYMGVAPGVQFVGMKVLDGDGNGRTSNVIGAIQWAITNRTRLGIDVINLSLGHPIYAAAADDPLVQAVEAAVRQGIVVVTSSGNFGQNKHGEIGYAGIASPGNAPSAITVGTAITRSTIERSDDAVADYSSRGPSWFDAFAKPDFVAPGDRLISDCPPDATITKSFPSLKVSKQRGCYIALSGTSMSAGVATGAVAIILEEVRKQNTAPVTPNAVKAVLQYTAIPILQANGEKYDGLTQGTGELNAAGAVTVAGLIDTSAPAGAPWVLNAPEPFSTFGGQPYAWAQNIVWGTTRVSNTNVLYSNALVWAHNIVWGTVLGDGDNIVWGTAADGDNIVWGTSAETWGDNIVWGTGLLRSADGDNIVWGTVLDGDNIVWGTVLDGDNIVWGTIDGDNIVWGTCAGDGDNIVWGTRGNDDGDNIVWGTRGNDDGDNIVWGTRHKGVKK